MIRCSDAAIRGEERRDIRLRNPNGASQAVHWQCTRVDESANGACRCVEELRGFMNCPELGDRSTRAGAGDMRGRLALRRLGGLVGHASPHLPRSISDANIGSDASRVLPGVARDTKARHSRRALSEN